jgi:hypothetical protein
VNPGALALVRELIELLALLVECTAADATSTPTLQRALENCAPPIGQLRERVQFLAQLTDMRARLVKSD